MKILISAFGCSPGEGSEHGRGWEFASRLSRTHGVWVITQAANRSKIDSHIQNHSYPNLHFAYLGIPLLDQIFKLVPGGTPIYAYVLNLYYYLWQLALYPLAVRLHREIGFDVSHHISFARYWTPSLLSLLPIAFVWGPVAGADLTPTKLLPALSMRGRLFEFARSCMIFLGEMDPLVRLTVRRAAFTIPCTAATFQRLEHLGAHRIRFAFDVGISIESLEEEENEDELTSPGCFVVMSVGRLVDWKGFSLGLRAFAQSRLPGAEYWLFGDGPDRKRLESLADSLGIRSKVHFFGKVPRPEVLRAYPRANVLLHPSLHETSGWAVMEAMFFGLPVVCLDLGGPARMVSNDAGICVPAKDDEQVVNDIARALSRLENDPELGKAYGDVGKKRITGILSWESIISQILSIYELLHKEKEGCPYEI